MTLADRGIYKCEAWNLAGNWSIEYNIEVFQTPEIVVQRSTAQALEGSNASLHCKAQGEPRPLVRVYESVYEYMDFGIVFFKCKIYVLIN